jgi:hypothetical protein
MTPVIPPLPKPEATEVAWDEWDKAVTDFGEPSGKGQEAHLILKSNAVNVLADSLCRHLKIRNEELAYLVAKKCIADLMEKQ